MPPTIPATASHTKLGANHSWDWLWVVLAGTISALAGAAAGWKWGVFWSQEGALEISEIELGMMGLVIVGVLVITLAPKRGLTRRIAFYLTNSMLFTAILAIIAGPAGGALSGGLVAAIFGAHFCLTWERHRHGGDGAMER
jgi:hypothetical protein